MTDYTDETKEWMRRATAGEASFGFRRHGALSVLSAIGTYDGDGQFQPSSQVEGQAFVRWKLVNEAVRRVPRVVLESWCEKQIAYLRSRQETYHGRRWKRTMENVGRTPPGSTHYYVVHDDCEVGITHARGVEYVKTRFSDCSDLVESEFYCARGQPGSESANAGGRGGNGDDHKVPPTGSARNAPEPSAAPSSTLPIRVFISYSRVDKVLRDEFLQHLSPLINDKVIEVWFDRAIEPGADWESAIERAIFGADLVLLLVSAPFLESPHCGKEMLQALARRADGSASVIPIILRHCDWPSVFNTDAYRMQALPRDGRPVAHDSQYIRDGAFTDVAQELRVLAGKLRQRRS